jgi:hypothetical protein
MVTGSISPSPTMNEHIAIAFDVTGGADCSPTASGYEVFANGAWTLDSVDCYDPVWWKSTEGTMYGLMYDLTSGLPTALYGFGHSSLMMSMSPTNAVGAIPMTSGFAQGSMSVSASGSPSLVDWQIGAVFNVGTHGAFEFVGNTAQATLATLATSGTTVGVSASAHTAPPDGSATLGPWSEVAAFQGGLDPSATVSLVLPDPFFTTAPADGSTGIAVGSTLSWQSVPNAAYRVDIACVFNGVGVVFGGSIYSSASQATIPNEPTANVAIPSGASCTWTVAAMGPASSVDDFASGALSPQNLTYWSEHPTATFDAITPMVSFVEQ